MSQLPPSVEPEGWEPPPPSEARRRGSRWPLLGVAAGVVLGAAWVVGTLSPSAPTTTTGLPPPPPPPPESQPQPAPLGPPPSPGLIPPSDLWYGLGAETRVGLWRLDPSERGPLRLLMGGLVDVVVRGETVFARRSGELVVAGPRVVHFYGVGHQVFAIGPPVNPTMAVTPHPVALIPVEEPGERFPTLRLQRLALDGSQFPPVPLPGCGIPYPVASPFTDHSFAVWCTAADELRAVTDLGESMQVRPVLALEGGRRGPVLLSRADELLLVTGQGEIWQMRLSGGEVWQSGRIELGAGEEVPGIAALTVDQLLLVGVTSATGTVVEAHRLLGFDLVEQRVRWHTELEHPISSLTALPDGRVFAFSPAAGGDPDPRGALLEVDPESGDTGLLRSDLPLETARLVPLPVWEE